MANRLTCFLPFVFGGSQWEDQEQQQAQATPETEIGIVIYISSRRNRQSKRILFHNLLYL